MSLTVATVGLDLMADALVQQGQAPVAVDWRPPASGDPDLVVTLTAAYGDDRICTANAMAIDRLQAARPMLERAATARELIPNLGGRTVLHAGPPVDRERMSGPQRRAVRAACVLEGWYPDVEAASNGIAAGEVDLATCHSHGAAGAMTGVISPSMAIWQVRDSETGIAAWSPLNDGPGDAFWLGVDSDEAIARQRALAGVVAPAFDAALAERGPIDVFALLAQAIAMGDDCHMRHQAATMLLLRQTLPGMARRAPTAVAAVADLLAANGHFALTITIAACRSALAGIVGIPHSSLVVFISRNGTDAAVQLAGMPGRWFVAEAPLVGDALYRPGFGDDDAAGDIGDSALVECCGLGAAASAASPSVAAFLGGGIRDAIARTQEMGDICVAASERFRIPQLDGLGTPLGVDARACVDLGQTPLINTGILHKTDGGQIGAGVARAPLSAVRDALTALVVG